MDTPVSGVNSVRKGIDAAVDDIATVRPTPRQSGIDVGANLPPGARLQVSYKDGQEVPYGTLGSVRPDWCIGNVCSIEVKKFQHHYKSEWTDQ